MSDAAITEMLNMDPDAWTPEQQQDMADVYRQLKKVARGQRLKVSNHGFNTTALVNEAWLKYRKNPRTFNDRNHFFAYCAIAMRHILYNQARRNRLVTWVDVDNEINRLPVHDQSEFFVDLERQLDALREFDPRLEKVFTYKFFGDMTFEEIADVLEVSERTALRDWKKARAMLSVSLEA